MDSNAIHPSTAPRTQGSAKAGLYPATQWSLVLDAADGDEEALNELFRSYWFPVYAGFREKVENHHDAEDLTQRLFSDIHRRGDLLGLSPRNGFFRSFLKAASTNLHRNFVSENTTQKRGGSSKSFSIDRETAEQWIQSDIAADEDPGKLFDRRWIFAIMENAKNDLRRIHIEQGKLPIYEALEDFLLLQERGTSYAEAANRLQQKESTARVAAHRMRESYRTLIRQRIADSVRSTAEAKEEMAFLSSLAGFSFLAAGARG